MLPTYQNLPVVLSPYVPDKTAPYDSYVATSSFTNMTPDTVLTEELRKDRVASDMPRTLVLFYAEDKSVYRLLSFVGKKIPPISCCTLLFDPPLPDLKLVPDPGTRSFTDHFELLKDFDLLKFGTAYYEPTMANIDLAFRAREASGVPPSTPIGFKNMQAVTSKYGKLFWEVFDEFFKQGLVETAVALLRRADPDEVQRHRAEIELILSTNKRARTS